MLRDFALSAVEPGPGATTGAVARDAATVVLLRDGQRGTDGVEVFVMRRTPTMVFAPRMHVFPGGGLERQDVDPAMPWHGPGPAWWASALGSDPALAAQLVCAAVRELFEETGVLLAGPADDPAQPVSPAEADRLAVLDRSLVFGQLLRDRGLVLRADLLRPWARWSTPRHEPRRYDARFFVAALPHGQSARDVGGEADLATWLPAAHAVSEHRGGRLAMLAPTLVALEEVASHPSVAAVLAAPRTVRPVVPWWHEGGLRVDLDGIGGGEPGPVS